MRILAVNPWIEDFAAYDYWLKPYGFLKILTYLKQHGAKIMLVDCLDRLRIGGLKSTVYGSGKFPAQRIPKPEILSNVPRHWKRYGMPEEKFEEAVAAAKNPDYILVTSSMTYWYTGVQHAIERFRALFPHAPIILGGTYATLCYDHACKVMDCEYIFKASQLREFFRLIDIPFDEEAFQQLLPDYPAFYPAIEYAVLKTGEGCRFDCAYCAAKQIAPVFYKIDSDRIAAYIREYYQRGIRNFVFFDDSLFYPQEYIKTVLDKLLRLNIQASFHTPNGLHVRYVDKELATMMKKLNFVRPYVSVEMLDEKARDRLSPKLDQNDIGRALAYLFEAGYRKGEIWCYLLFCLPGQDLNAVVKDAQDLHELGLSVYLTEFSPIPGTRIVEEHRIEIADPLLTNNSIYLFFQENFREVFRIKTQIRKMNQVW